MSSPKTVLSLSQHGFYENCVTPLLDDSNLCRQFYVHVMMVVLLNILDRQVVQKSYQLLSKVIKGGLCLAQVHKGGGEQGAICATSLGGVICFGTHSLTLVCQSPDLLIMLQNPIFLSPFSKAVEERWAKVDIFLSS